jgi:hypothetical protein
LPRFEEGPSTIRSSVDICRGTSPSQAPKARPLIKVSSALIAATMPLEMIGSIPGMLTIPVGASHGVDLVRQLSDSLV